MTDGRIALFGMPCWDAQKPFHALALAGGIARGARVPFSLHDLNIEFFHHVEQNERNLWNESSNHLWFTPAMPSALWEKYEPWITARLDEALAGEVKLAAFSVNMSTRYFSMRAARYLKSRRPDIPVMFGGVDCFPREHGKRFLESGSPCDIICQGEAEIAFTRYLEELSRTGDWRPTTPGFAYRDGDRIVDTGPAPLPDLQEKQPLPVYEAFDLSKYTAPGQLPFYLSRGCVYHCKFCSEGPNFIRYRRRRAEEAFEELIAILPLAQRHAAIPSLSFADSIINADIKTLRTFAELIIQHGIKIQWAGQGHFHPKMTYEFLATLKEAGFVSFFWGFESGSQNVVNLMNKRYSQTVARRIIDDCVQLGISQHLPVLIGYPGETAADVVDTIEFILRYRGKPRCHVHLPCQVIVRPNSPLFDDPGSFGLENARDGYGWKLRDNSNTLPIRIARRFVARQAHGNADLSYAGLVDTEEIKNISLDELGAARDLFTLIGEVFSRAGQADALPRRLGAAAGAQAAWLEKDKNSAQGRVWLYTLILDALRALRDTVRLSPLPAGSGANDA